MDSDEIATYLKTGAYKGKTLRSARWPRSCRTASAT